MSTIFGFLLLIGSIYSLYDLVKSWKGLLTGQYEKTIAQISDEAQSRTPWQAIKSCFAVPFVVFREYAFLTLWIPALAIYGLIHDHKAMALAVLFNAIVLAVVTFKNMARVIKLGTAYAEHKRRAEKLGTSYEEGEILLPKEQVGKTLLLLEGQVGKLVGDETLLPGGTFAGLFYTLSASVCNLYVMYLFYVVVISA